MNHVHARPDLRESPPFHFETRWLVADAPDRVWAVLSDVESWPQWWPGVGLATRLGGAVGQGSRADVTVRSPIGLALTMTLRVDDLDPPSRVTLSADGDLRGHGVWTVHRSGPLTVIDSVWCVTTQRRTVRLIRPLSALMHSVVMRAGERGLRRRLSEQAARTRR